MPPNLMNTLYFRLQDQNRQNQLAQRAGENANAEIMLKAGDQAERTRQGAFDRELAQSEALGRQAALEGKAAPEFDNGNFNIASGAGAAEERGKLKATEQKGQLLRDIQMLRDREAAKRADAAQNAATDRTGIAAQSAEDVARINQGGLNYRAKHYQRAGSEPKPPDFYAEKNNPFVRQIKDNEAKMAVYGKLFKDADVQRIEKENRQLWRHAQEHARQHAQILGYDSPGIDVDQAGPVAPAPTAPPPNPGEDGEEPPDEDTWDKAVSGQHY